MELIDKRYASIGTRLIAILVDGLILSFLGYLIFGKGGSYSLPSFSYSFGQFVLSGAYFILQEGSSRKATLGKRILNIHIESSNQNPMDYKKATVRYLGKLISALILMIGYIIALFSKENLALHDRFANTVVLKD